MDDNSNVMMGLSNQQLDSLNTVFSADALAGKTIVIAGATGGIGKATAWLCSRLGARLVLLGRNVDKLAALQQALTHRGALAFIYPVNVRDSEGVRQVFSQLTDEAGGFDVLINCAGGQFPQPAIDISDKGWHAVIDTNLNGSWYLMQTAAKYWRDTKRSGAVVNVVTVVDRGMVDMAHSCAARAGVIHLSKTVAVEWAPYNIRVNCVAPGVIASEGMQVYSDEARQHFPNSNPMKRMGSPWEIAQSVAYLASDASAFVTGEVLTVDGGGRLWGDLWPHDKPDYFKI